MYHAFKNVNKLDCYNYIDCYNNGHTVANLARMLAYEYIVT